MSTAKANAKVVAHRVDSYNNYDAPDYPGSDHEIQPPLKLPEFSLKPPEHSQGSYVCIAII